jgi:hypothetical protein
MLITLGIGSLVMMAVMQTALFTARSFVAMGNYADLDRASRNALDTMSREIREAKAVRYLGSSLIFTNMDNSWFYYLWDQNNRIVSRVSGRMGVSGARTERLLVGCDSSRCGSFKEPNQPVLVSLLRQRAGAEHQTRGFALAMLPSRPQPVQHRKRADRQNRSAELMEHSIEVNL